MNWFYIIYSASKDTYYIGETANIEERIRLHNDGTFKRSYTKMAEDWSLVLILECKNRAHARRLETFVKSMKSKKFISKLIVDKEMQRSILIRFS